MRRRTNRDTQTSWDAVSLAILIVALVVVSWILLPAVWRATAKGDESPEQRAESGEPKSESPLSDPAAQVKQFALHLPCVVTQIVDGDTVTVELRLQARVRLEDCWAPEVVGGTQASKEAGLASKRHLESVAEGRVGGLNVVLDGATRLDDVFSFGRIVGRVWVDGTGDLARKQVLSGHAFRTKDELLQALAESDGRAEGGERRAESEE